MDQITMPRLSDSMEEGTIIRWLAADGEPVAIGAEIAEIETDKATMEFQSEFAGVLHIVEPEGATLPVGSVIGQVLAPGEQPGAGEGAASASAPESASESAAVGSASDGGNGATATVAPPRSAAPANGHGRVQASPIARRLAEAMAIDLQALVGTGPPRPGRQARRAGRRDRVGDRCAGLRRGGPRRRAVRAVRADPGCCRCGGFVGPVSRRDADRRQG